jgi:hypothetical protein
VAIPLIHPFFIRDHAQQEIAHGEFLRPLTAEALKARDRTALGEDAQRPKPWVND